ncbi:MAG: homoserine kinase [Oscillospiraceae bacterium]|jgi:homoserine kinase|nr:homoserine kinase [Oscillospiraceae bacterium]
MVKIRIPATSANIGPGFDALGVAVSMYNYVYMRESDTLSILSRDGADIPLDAENLVYKTVRRVYEACGKKLRGLALEQINNIPFARGLGSSSACIIGGLIGANEMLGGPLGQDEIIDMAAVMEGHPDNSTPALTGGLVTAVLDGGRVHYVKQDVSDDLKFAVIIPDFELKTSLARSVLPDTVSHVDARFNLARAALMAVSLYSGKYENLRAAADDRLHHPYRLELIPKGRDVMEMCYQNGAYASYVSGAGSSIMAIVDDAVLDFGQKTRDSLDEMGLQSWGLHILSIDNKGAILMRD